MDETLTISKDTHPAPSNRGLHGYFRLYHLIALYRVRRTLQPRLSGIRLVCRIRGRPFDMLNSARPGKRIRCRAIKRCARPFPHLSRSAWSVGDVPTISAPKPRFMPRMISASRLDHVSLSDACGNVGLYLHILRDYVAIMF